MKLRPILLFVASLSLCVSAMALKCYKNITLNCPNISIPTTNHDGNPVTATCIPDTSSTNKITKFVFAQEVPPETSGNFCAVSNPQQRCDYICTYVWAGQQVSFTTYQIRTSNVGTGPDCPECVNISH